MQIRHVLNPTRLYVDDGLPTRRYAIRQEVEEGTDGGVRLWPATLYGTLKDLTRRGWIEETESPEREDDDPRRRYYALAAARASE